MLEFKCLGSSLAISVCANKQCLLNAFLCQNNECCSAINHEKCKIIEMGQFHHYYENDRLRQSMLIQNIEQFYDKSFMQLKSDVSNYSEWMKIRFIKQKLILQHKSENQSITGKYIGELLQGWINCDEDFTEEVNYCLQHATKTVLKQLSEIRELFGNLKKRIDQGRNPRNSRNSMSMLQIPSTIVWKEEDTGSLNRILNSQFKVKQVNRIFHAEENKFMASAFHQYCDGRANTLVLAKTSKQKIIGGFTPVSWESDNFGKFKTDVSQRSFIFSVTNEEKYPLKLKEFAIECNCFSGPVFGKGALWIEDNSNTNQAYWSQIPTSYQPLNSEWTAKSYHQFIGADKNQKFTISDWEVFEVIFD